MAALSETQGVAEAIGRVSSSFSPGLPLSACLKEPTEREMIKRFESALFAGFLQQTINGGQQAELTHFFRMQVDVRNFILVAKHRRWGIANHPCLLAGGLIAEKKIYAATDLRDSIVSSQALSGSWAGGLQFASYPCLEGALFKRIALILTRRSRSSCGISQTLDYLWQRYLAARNASLLGQTGNLPFELLNEEFIQ
jgi:hypothetical protein